MRKHRRTTHLEIEPTAGEWNLFLGIVAICFAMLGFLAIAAVCGWAL